MANRAPTRPTKTQEARKRVPRVISEPAHLKAKVSVRRDIAIIQEELPCDVIEFFCLTPLPGSEDLGNLLSPSFPAARSRSSCSLPSPSWWLQPRENALQDFNHVGAVLLRQIDKHVQAVALL